MIVADCPNCGPVPFDELEYNEPVLRTYQVSEIEDGTVYLDLQGTYPQEESYWDHLRCGSRVVVLDEEPDLEFY